MAESIIKVTKGKRVEVYRISQVTKFLEKKPCLNVLAKRNLEQGGVKWTSKNLYQYTAVAKTKYLKEKLLNVEDRTRKNELRFDELFIQNNGNG